MVNFAKIFSVFLISTIGSGAVFGQTQGAEDSLDWAKKKCVDLGFKVGTERFGGCVLQLSRKEDSNPDAKGATNQKAVPGKRNQMPAQSLQDPIFGNQSASEDTASANGPIKDCADCPDMVVIPGGSFTMGSSVAEQALLKIAYPDSKVSDREGPQHAVTLKAFAVGKFAVTKGEFANFVSATGYKTEAEHGGGCSLWSGTDWKTDQTYNWRNVGFLQVDDHPVVCVSWNDAKAYAQWLNQISGKTYRLLSEAEREYAARGGTQTAFWWGHSITTTHANYSGNTSYNGSPKGQSLGATVPVNIFPPNPFGLYNVHGNVWEWVEDCLNETYTGAPNDGRPWVSGNCDSRILRGGAWSTPASGVRAGSRSSFRATGRTTFIGFRVARTN